MEKKENPVLLFACTAVLTIPSLYLDLAVFHAFHTE